MTTALEGVRGQRHAPAALYPRERPGTHSIGGCVGPSAGLDRCGKFLPDWIRSSDRPARSQSLYRLRYLAHYMYNMVLFYDGVTFEYLVVNRIVVKGVLFK